MPLRESTDLQCTITFRVTKSNIFHGENQSHVIEPKSFFLELPLVHPDQVFSVVVVFILEDLTFHPYSSFFL